MKMATCASIGLAAIAPSMIAGQQPTKDAASSPQPRSTATQKSSKIQHSSSAGKKAAMAKDRTHPRLKEGRLEETDSRRMEVL
jgi:hypothetical protein